MSAENREVEQLRAFIDETTAEVAEARNKFSHQEDLVDAFNGDATAVGYVAAIARADKFKARLVAARARQETSYNREATNVESTNKTVTVIARKASDEEVDAKANDNKFLKRKLKHTKPFTRHTTHIKQLSHTRNNPTSTTLTTTANPEHPGTTINTNKGPPTQDPQATPTPTKTYNLRSKIKP